MDSQAFLGRSLAVCELVDDARTIARSDATVLITGPRGAGKTHLARLIHDQSGRSGRPFLQVSCTGVQDAVLEAELFGDPGSETARGLFDLANGGTVVLDEVGDLSESLQNRLLEFLEETSDPGYEVGQRRRPGIISTTSGDLFESTQRHEFSDRLFYRLNVVHLVAPALQERAEDIPLLVEHFARLASQQHNVTAPSISSEAYAVLQAHDWPGNVTELMALVERIVVRPTGHLVSASDVVAELAMRQHARSAGAASSAATSRSTRLGHFTVGQVLYRAAAQGRPTSH
jgi:DNA-binding NtrC family response regulator